LDRNSSESKVSKESDRVDESNSCRSQLEEERRVGIQGLSRAQNDRSIENDSLGKICGESDDRFNPWNGGGSEGESGKWENSCESVVDKRRDGEGVESERTQIDSCNISVDVSIELSISSSIYIDTRSGDSIEIEGWLNDCHNAIKINGVHVDVDGGRRVVPVASSSKVDGIRS